MRQPDFPSDAAFHFCTLAHTWFAIYSADIILECSSSRVTGCVPAGDRRSLLVWLLTVSMIGSDFPFGVLMRAPDSPGLGSASLPIYFLICSCKPVGSPSYFLNSVNNFLSVTWSSLSAEWEAPYPLRVVDHFLSPLPVILAGCLPSKSFFLAWLTSPETFEVVWGTLKSRLRNP